MLQGRLYYTYARSLDRYIVQSFWANLSLSNKKFTCAHGDRDLSMRLRTSAVPARTQIGIVCYVRLSEAKWRNLRVLRALAMPRTIVILLSNRRCI